MLVTIGLLVVVLCVLLLPFLIRKIEEQLESFLFVMGITAVTITSQWHFQLVIDALIEPVKITVIVLAAGIIFSLLQKPLDFAVKKMYDRLGVRVFSLLIIFILGFLSSIITAIIASLILVEIISALDLDRKNEVRLVVLSCFSIGIGAALTPIGEPLSTLVIAALKGEPYYAGFWFLVKNFAIFIVPGIIGLSIFSIFFIKPNPEHDIGLSEEKRETLIGIIIRAIKVYVFIMALIFLGAGFRPVIDMYISKIPSLGLYWINMISAILDNATIVAAEISPKMELSQIRDAVLGLIISGGMLIPGNIPNIISANKLKIKSLEWAKYGIPLGLIILAVYFLVLLILK